MLITFDELRKVKDRLPHGSMQKIADELGIDVQTVRNYFGADHYSGMNAPGLHYQKGPHGGIVQIDDTRIFECAKKLLGKN